MEEKALTEQRTTIYDINSVNNVRGTSLHRLFGLEIWQRQWDPCQSLSQSGMEYTLASSHLLASARLVNGTVV